jgi:hypothetical protein
MFLVSTSFRDRGWRLLYLAMVSSTGGFYISLADGLVMFLVSTSFRDRGWRLFYLAMVSSTGGFLIFQ